MCGIAGMWDHEFPDDAARDILSRMSRCLRHRGPEEEGEKLFSQPRAGLACRRLRLVDLETGSQPIANEDGSLFLVANGEIYNHRELRRDLAGRGHRFRTATDIEVILHLYEDDGTNLFARLNGMYAFALMDLRHHSLLVARDPCGMKPLYHARTSSGFLFASEPEAILASGALSAEPDWTAIDTYLAVGYVPAPRTCFRGIQKLKAGDYMVLGHGRAEIGTHWRPRYQSRTPPPSDRECAEELKGLLERAVQSHLAADVPVGVFLSGGWDSSLVAMLAARQSGRRLETFSIVFPDHPAIDEGRFARRVATEIGSNHHEVTVSPANVVMSLPDVARRLGEPCLASPAFLFYQLAALASGSVKAVVGGEGADELFAGYPWLQRRTDLHYTLRHLVPRPLFRAAGDRLTTLEWSRLARVLGAEDDLAADAEWYRVFPPPERDRLLQMGSDGSPLAPLCLDDDTYGSCRDRLSRRLALEFTRRLPEGILLVADRMSMAHSVEVRMPFLDRHVVEYALSLPSNMKRRGKQEKYVLSLLTGLLPPELANRRKFGLVAPMRDYLRGPLRQYVRELLLDGSALGGRLDRAWLEKSLERWLAAPDPYLRRPWSLVMLQHWWDQYFPADKHEPAAICPPR